MKFRGIIRTKPSIELTADQTVHHCASDENMLKGLLKGLRYISQIFDAVDRDDDDDKEEHEMQIGYPTDVKHVAHIGWNGSSTNSPTWMKGFASDQNSQRTAYGGEPKDLTCSPDLTNSSPELQGLISQDVPEEKPKAHKHHHASSRGGASATDHNTGNHSPKKTRHRSSSGGSSSECSKPTRKHHHHRHHPSGSSSDFSGQDSDIVGTTTKQSRRRKTSGRKPAKSPKSKGVVEGDEKGSDQFPSLKIVKEEGEE